MLTGSPPQPLQPSHPPWLRRHWSLLCIGLAFLLLGSTYTLQIPLFETLDEPAHFLRAVDLAGRMDHESLAELSAAWPPDRAAPPLSAWLFSLAVRRLDLGDGGQPYLPNPYVSLDQPEATGNKNALLHVGQDERPLDGVGRAVLILRMVSVLFALGTVCLTYFTVLQVIPQWPSVAIGSAIVAALNPQFIFESARVGPSSLSTMLITLSLFLAVRIARGWGLPWWLPAVFGTVMGLSALSSNVGLAALALAPITYVLRLRGRIKESWIRGLAIPCFITIAAAAVVSGWWYVQYEWVPGPTDLAGRADSGVAATSFLLRAGNLRHAFASFWGLFGWLNVPADDVYYTSVMVLSVLSAIGLLIKSARTYWRSRKLPLPTRTPSVMVAVWTTLGVALLGWLALTRDWAFGPTLFSAISATSFFFFEGLASWVARRDVGILAAVLAAFLFSAAALVPNRYIEPAYAPPSTMSLRQVPSEMRDVDIDFGGDLYLLGYVLEDERVQPGGTVDLQLFWLSRRRTRENYVIQVGLDGRAGARSGETVSHGGAGSYPTSMWVPGRVIPEHYAIPVTENTKSPTRAVLYVSVRDGSGPTHLMASAPSGETLGLQPAVAEVRLVDVEAGGTAPDHPLEAGLGGKVSLVGYDLEPRPGPSGERWEVTLYWQTQQPMGADYTVFLHLVDSSGAIVAQTDEQPLRGEYPTSLWQTGDLVRDLHILEQVGPLSPGEYQILTGLYRADTGQRLQISGTEPRRDSVSLAIIRIGGPVKQGSASEPVSVTSVGPRHRSDG